MSERINFRDRIPKLSEEHIKQICRFTKVPYVEGEWQRARAYVEFKKWHHEKLIEKQLEDSRILDKLGKP